MSSVSSLRLVVARAIQQSRGEVRDPTTAQPNQWGATSDSRHALSETGIIQGAIESMTPAFLDQSPIVALCCHRSSQECFDLVGRGGWGIDLSSYLDFIGNVWMRLDQIASAILSLIFSQMSSKLDKIMHKQRSA